jgi:uncharacterized membrane protein (UPF0127 family)
MGRSSCAAIVALMVGVALAACGSDGEGGDADPAVISGQPQEFETATLTSTQADGSVREWCVWHADTSERRSRGLMEVTDLREPIGMAFSYRRPTNGTFYMYRTPLPLSIAWFGPDGEFVGATNMVPCSESDPEDCARYSPGVEYTLAVEVPQGELLTYGLIPGSTAEIVPEPCA